MGFKCAIVGLPNVGKSTLFNAMTQAGIQAENYPFCTIDPNVGVVNMPDPRLDAIADIVKPQKVIPTTMQFVDVAGLVKGASQGEGLGNQFLAHIRETEAIAHVVRCFEDENVTHVSGKVSPLDDITTIATELALSDLETVTQAIQRHSKFSRQGDKAAKASVDLLERLEKALNENCPVRNLDLNADEKAIIKPLNLLTQKPTLYIANVHENGFDNNPLLEAVKKQAKIENAEVVPISAAIESELATLDAEEARAFLDEMGLTEPGLARVIRAGYRLLDLETYFTAGVKEVRAWTLKARSTAPQAAGKIHTDFEKGFIRAEIISYDDFIQFKGEQGAKDAGKWRLEGKDYIVQDGDVIHFRFNV